MRLKIALVTAVVVAIVVLVSWTTPKKMNALTVDDLPENSIFIEHPEDEIVAEETNGIAIRHYATPEAIKAGGPVFGVFGYRIISIEYELPLGSIGEHVLGKISPGEDLVLTSLNRAGDTIPYNHFHIGKVRHVHADEGRSGVDAETILIHFMLIPHDEEIQYGLMCG